MKPKWLLVPFVLFQFENTSAQTHDSFPDSAAQWSEYFYSCGDINEYCYEDGDLITEARDTVIYSTKYILLGYNKTYELTILPLFGIVSTETYRFQLPGKIFGGLRKDSLDRVYFRLLDSSVQIPNIKMEFPLNTDVLLYDFNLKIGDSLPWKPYDHIVKEIDSVQLMNGLWRKVFVFGGYVNINAEHWIDGIGSEFGLLGPYEEYGGTLSCYRENNNWLYYNSTDTDNYSASAHCDMVYAGIENFSTKVSVSVLPNPASEFIHFDFGTAIHQKCQLQIRNATGKLVSQIELNKNNIEIPVSSLGANGIYFYQLISDNQQISSGKFLIQR